MSSNTKTQRKKKKITKCNQVLPVSGNFCLEKAVPIVKLLDMNLFLK